MDQLTKNLRKMISAGNLKVSMSEMARVAGVSTSQLRYWDRKGFIKSEQDEQNKNHYFSLRMLFQVCTIKMYLDQGYTLAVAVQKERERRKYHGIFKQFIVDRVMGISEHDGCGEIDLGPLSDEPSKKVVAVVENGQTRLKLKPVNNKNDD